MRLFVVLCVIGALADAFVFLSGGFMKGARSGTRKNMFNPFAPKKGGDDEGGIMGGGGGAMGGLVEMMRKAEKMKMIMEDENIIVQDPSGGVTVTFNGMAGPKSVVISDKMMGLGATALSQAITNTIIEAHSKSTENMNSKMMSMIPGGGKGLDMDM